MFSNDAGGAGMNKEVRIDGFLIVAMRLNLAQERKGRFKSGGRGRGVDILF